MHVDTVAAICFSEMQRHFKGEWQLYIRRLLMALLDLQILFSASWRGKAENKTTLQNSRFGAWHTGQKRSQENVGCSAESSGQSSRRECCQRRWWGKGTSQSSELCTALAILSFYPFSFIIRFKHTNHGRSLQAVSVESRHEGQSWYTHGEISAEATAITGVTMRKWRHTMQNEKHLSVGTPLSV